MGREKSSSESADFFFFFLPLLKLIQYGSESQKEKMQRTDTLHRYNCWVLKPSEISVFWSLLPSDSRTVDSQDSLKNAAVNIYVGEEHIVFFFYLPLSYRTESVLSLTKDFFSITSYSAGGWGSLIQFCWRSSLIWLPGGHSHPMGSETKKPNAVLAPQKKLYYIMFCLGWHVK